MMEQQCFASLRNQKKQLSIFHKILWVYIYGNKKDHKLLNDSSNEESKFTTKKWYVIDSQTAENKYNQNNSVKIWNRVLHKSCDYSDTFI